MPQQQVDYSKLAQELGGFSVGHDEPSSAPASTYEKYGPLQQLLKEQAEPKQTRAESLSNAPAIGAMAAPVAAQCRIRFL
mgnify:CR=1 FL=1